METRAVQFSKLHLMHTAFTAWTAQKHERANQMERVKIAIQHWSHQGLANAFAAWILYTEEAMWRKWAMSQVLMKLGGTKSRSMRAAFEWWAKYTQRQLHSRAVLKDAHQRLMERCLIMPRFWRQNS